MMMMRIIIIIIIYFLVNGVPAQTGSLCNAVNERRTDSARHVAGSNREYP